MTATRRVARAPVGTIVLFALLALQTVAVGPARAAGGSGWTVVTSPNQGTLANGLADVAGTSPSDVWAVGAYAFIPPGSAPITHTLAERWNGSAWSMVATPNIGQGANSLDGVAAVSPTDAWAVGNFFDYAAGLWKSLALHWNGTAWRVVATPNPSARYNALEDVAAVSASDVWAVGIQQTSGPTIQNRTLVEHWDGRAWTVVAGPATGTGDAYLNAVSARSATDAWAVGNRGSRSLVEHWNGTAWSIVASPSPGGVANQLVGVTARSATDAWAVGALYPSGGGPQRTLVLRWNGTAWSVVSSPNSGTGNNELFGVAALTATDVWAVGTFYDANQGALLERWNGSSWAIVPSGVTASESSLLGATAFAPQTVWAVGGFEPSSRDVTLALRTTSG